jgi:hypothetical protein
MTLEFLILNIMSVFSQVFGRKTREDYSANEVPARGEIAEIYNDFALLMWIGGDSPYPQRTLEDVTKKIRDAAQLTGSNPDEVAAKYSLGTQTDFSTTNRLKQPDSGRVPKEQKAVLRNSEHRLCLNLTVCFVTVCRAGPFVFSTGETDRLRWHREPSLQIADRTSNT